MIKLITVMAGGGVGAGARYLAGEAFAPRFGAPLTVLGINLIGGLLMGLLAGVIARGSAGEGARLLLAVGVLGGFTTFSAFSLDVVRLIERGVPLQAAGYILASVVGSVALTFAGLAIVRLA